MSVPTLAPCRTCGNATASTAAACPACGDVAPHDPVESPAEAGAAARSSGGGVAVAIGVVVVLFAGVFIYGGTLESDETRALRARQAGTPESRWQAGTAAGAVAGDEGRSFDAQSATVSTLDDLGRQVALDAERQYEMVTRNGSATDRCVYAMQASAAWVQAGDQAAHDRWKAQERADCAAAGVPR